MADIFKFKQFDVNQSGCAMKVNTDGVLLSALANAERAGTILDIGTGTGVIALMLAQRFPNARVEAVEIDTSAAETAGSNFKASKFAERLQLHPMGFEEYFTANAGKHFDVIISNPPFFLNSLTSPTANKSLAKHADASFFEGLIAAMPHHLTDDGKGILILPLATAAMVKGLLHADGLYLQGVINIKSFAESEPHREIITFGKKQVETELGELFIYDKPKVYSPAYQHTLKEFLTIF